MYFDYHVRENDDSAPKQGEASVIIRAEDLLSGMYNGVDLSLFATIVASMNRAGESYVTQEQLAKQLGLSKTTVNNRIKKLLSAEVNGKPFLIRELINVKGCKKASRYTLPDCTVAPTLEDLPEAEFTAPEIIKFFCQEYEKEYGVEYTPNWVTDGKAVKSKLVGHYSKEHVEEVIQYIMKNYTTNPRWGNKQFPRPRIGMMCKWLFQQASELVQAKKPKEGFKSEAEIAEEQRKQDEIARRYF